MTFSERKVQPFDPDTVERPRRPNLGTLRNAEITDTYDPAYPFEYELDAEDLQRVWGQRWNANNNSLDIHDLNQRQRAGVIYYLQKTIVDDELGAKCEHKALNGGVAFRYYLSPQHPPQLPALRHYV